MIDFPNAPVDGQIFVAPTGVSYRWVAASGLWVTAAGTTPGGDFTATNSAAYDFTGGGAALLLNTVVTGNVGNWYNPTTGRYTPPAGRYFIAVSVTGFNGGSTTGNATMNLRKNGVNLQGAQTQAVASGSVYAMGITGEFDANGTDYFDVFGVTSASQYQAGARQIMFTAFPVSGVQGPPGPPGSATTAAFNVRNTANGFALAGPNYTSVFRSPGAPVKDYDPNNVITVANACQFIAPTDGRYHMELFLYLAQTAANQCSAVIQHTNVAGAVVRSYGDLHTADNNAYAAQFHVTADIQMLANEKVDWLYSNTSGTTTPISNGTIGGLAASAITYAFGHRIGT
jgi:hypothetical protein